MTEKFSKEEIEKAYSKFRFMQRVPADLQPTLKEARLARQMSMSMVAKNLGISKQAYCKIERANEKGVVSIKQLKRIAAAIDCELVMHFKAKGSRTFARDLWDQLLPFALKYPGRGNLEFIVLEDCFPHPEIRRRLGWARKKYVQWPRYLCWERWRWPFTV